MRTYPHEDNAGNVTAFEIENAYISIRKIQKLLSSVDGISNCRRRKLFSRNEEFRLAFDYLGTVFLVLEPFGDNSRYWIGPENKSDGNVTVKLRELESVFKAYTPPVWIKIPADIVTLRFLRSGT